MKVTQCRLCKGKLSEPKINLSHTPLANEFLSNKTTQDTFPLEVCVCESCEHYQLNETVDPERLFRHYVYVAGTSPVNVQHFKDYADHIFHKFCFAPKDKVLDIASNDGTLLQHFKNLGMQVLGIDPAQNIAAQANQQGIPTIPEFFTEEYADVILAEHGEFDLITANNVFAHIPDMIGFAKGIKKILAFNGVFTFEVSYFADVCDKLLFDTIYHEHTSYHTIKPLISFFSSHGLNVFHVDYIGNHGGSIRVYVNHNEVGAPVYSSFDNQDIRMLGSILKGSLTALNVVQKKKIAIYGVPAKATTLMYALGIDEKHIKFAIEDNPLKQGTFTPGKHIPVFSFDKLIQEDIDVVLILAWNFAESIMKKCRDNGFKGDFIVPLPKFSVIKGLK
jgi:hypothetical protein